MPGLSNPLTRVTVFLPQNSAKELSAIWALIYSLKHMPEISGWTQIDERNPSLTGIWWSKKQQKWLPDRLVLFIIDLDFVIGDHCLNDLLSKITKEIQDLYQNCGSPQEEVWIVAESITQFDTQPSKSIIIT